MHGCPFSGRVSDSSVLTCPFAHGVKQEKNTSDPGLDLHSAHSLPYQSPYQALMEYTKDKSQVALRRLKANRKRFNAYPPYLQNSLFHGFMVRRLRKRGVLERVMAANELRQGGNDQYHKGEYATAANCYEQGLGLLTYLQWVPTEDVDVTLRELSDDDYIYVGLLDLDDHDTKVVSGTTIQLTLNLALAYLQLQYFPQAHYLLESLLLRCPHNHAVLVRAALCKLVCLESGLDDLRLALELVNKAIELHPCDEYTELISKVSRKIQDVENEQRGFFVEFLKQVKSFKAVDLAESSPADTEFEHKVMQKLASKYPKMIQFYTDNEQPEKIPKFKAEMALVQSVLHRMNWIEGLNPLHPCALLQETAEQLGLSLTDPHNCRAFDRSKRMFIVKAFSVGKYSNSLVVHCIEECAAEAESAPVVASKAEMEGNWVWQLATVAFLVLAAVLYYCATPDKGMARLSQLAR